MSSAESRSGETAASSGATVLVVDDDRDVREALSELLSDEGYRVFTAAHGGEVLTYLEENPIPDCLVLDLWMPVMDGWTLAAELRRLGVPSIPTVVATGAAALTTIPRGADY